MMTEWDDLTPKTCPVCHERLNVPPWPTSGEVTCPNGHYRGYAFPNRRRGPLVSGYVRLILD